MDYNQWIDLAIFGGALIVLFTTIIIMDRRGSKSQRVHMIDQKRRGK